MPIDATFASYPLPNAHLGANHGYAFNQDSVLLRAAIHLVEPLLAGQSLTLQLWACPHSYCSGLVHGTKVAEVPVPSNPTPPGLPISVEREVVAKLPLTNRDHAMVLVLAAGPLEQSPHVYDVYDVCDFANYPRRERFAGPTLEGTVGYQLDGDQVTLSVEAVRNSRDALNLSGSLSLELHAIRDTQNAQNAQGAQDPATGGHLLANAAVSPINGQSGLFNMQYRTAFAPPPPGSWQLALLLREWVSGLGPVTRDYTLFAQTYEQPAARPVLTLVKPASPTRTGLKRTARARQRPLDAPAEPMAKAEPMTKAEPKAEPKPKAEPMMAKAAPVTAHATVQHITPITRLKRPTKSDKVSISTATVDQLTAVKGLNRKWAQAIVKARPFRSLEDLLKIRGIGRTTLSKLRAVLEL